jgi:phosphatidylserine/phosphatidylglycerophosphate/cardiolipin synthase-like enzyme
VKPPSLLLLTLLLSSPQEEPLQVHFAPSGERRILEAEIGREIRRAGREICVAMFHFTSDRLVQALAERRRSGVPVRILLDALQTNEGFIRKLRGEGLEVRRVTPREKQDGRFHHKYAVLDGRIVVTGSYNWTIQGDIANHENVLILRHESVAREYRDNFEKTWQDKDPSQP